MTHALPCLQLRCTSLIMQRDPIKQRGPATAVVMEGGLTIYDLPARVASQKTDSGNDSPAADEYWVRITLDGDKDPSWQRCAWGAS